MIKKTDVHVIHINYSIFVLKKGMNITHTHIYIYTYIYTCVCVCVCVRVCVCATLKYIETKKVNELKTSKLP